MHTAITVQVSLLIFRFSGLGGVCACQSSAAKRERERDDYGCRYVGMSVVRCLCMLFILARGMNGFVYSSTSVLRIYAYF